MGNYLKKEKKRKAASSSSVLICLTEASEKCVSRNYKKFLKVEQENIPIKSTFEETPIQAKKIEKNDLKVEKPKSKWF